MGTNVSAHVAVYGNTRIMRAFCAACDGEAFVLSGVMACCGAKPGAEPDRYKIIVAPKRRKPSGSEQDRILAEQDHCCRYCRNQFGTLVQRPHCSAFPLRVVWDHFWPFVQYGLNEEFVAACQVCNRLKWARAFDSVEDARAYIIRRWDKNGYIVLDADSETV